MATTIHPMLFQGKLLNRQGDAVPGAKIQMWQTDLNGNYNHPHPGAAVQTALAEHASIVSNFQYFGTDETDSDGAFDFLTYRPGIYSGRPYGHFHVMVWLDDPTVVGDESGEEPSPALITQFYFRDESPPSNRFPEVLQLDVAAADADVYGFGSYVNGTIVIDSGSGEALLDTSPVQAEGPYYPVTDFFSLDNDLTLAVSPETVPATPPPTVAPTQPPTSSTTPGPTPGPALLSLSDTVNAATSTARRTAAPATTVVVLSNSPTSGPMPLSPLNGNIAQPASMAATAKSSANNRDCGVNFFFVVSCFMLRRFFSL